MIEKEILQKIEQAAKEKLTEFSLLGVKIGELPPEIGKLNNLMKLILSNNQLTALPPEIGKLNNLTELNLRNNQLTALPPEIGKLNNLRTLNLEENKLTALPPQIRQLNKLQTLDLRDNPLPIPPEILEKKNQPITIINYYFEHLAGEKRALNEAKILLVGQASVGKTSLVNRLLGGKFRLDEDTTRGINIEKWRVEVDGQDIQLNMWDFGGQEIMHATHQFFLTKRSLYLLVLDSRLGEEENRLEYWLEIIRSFGGDSPVIVVGNKIDQQTLDIDRRGLLSKYTNVKAIVDTSCKTGKGIDKLKEKVASEIGSLEHVHDEFLVNWYAVKTRLEQITENYITHDQYVRMCERENITKETSQHTLIGFLHDLGIVLCFQDDPRLRVMGILNPEWVTTGVYKILNSHQLFQSKGVLERKTLNQILDSKEYPKDKHLFIIDMMRKFELCFDFEGMKDKKFLIPDLLSKEEPFVGDWGDTLTFQYHYNVLPLSIISRFIVRMHPLIHQNTAWRSGVMLKKDGNKALVKADTVDKKIFIWVSGLGMHRRSFLTKIRREFDSIHGTIPGIITAEKIPLPSHPDVLISYDHLLNLEKLGEADFIPEGLHESVNVQEILNGIISEEDRRLNEKFQEYTQQFAKEKQHFRKDRRQLIRWSAVLGGFIFSASLFDLAGNAIFGELASTPLQILFITLGAVTGLATALLYERGGRK